MSRVTRTYESVLWADVKKLMSAHRRKDFKNLNVSVTVEQIGGLAYNVTISYDTPISKPL